MNDLNSNALPNVAGLNDNGLAKFKEYDSQLSIPEIAGTRVIKCLYQVAKTGVNKGKKIATNSYIRIPADHINEEVIISKIEELAPYVVSYLQEKEDLIIKELHKTGATSVFTPKLSIGSILEYLEENETSGRLNKEMIEAWFRDSIEPELTSLFAEKLGLHADSEASELEKLAVVINAYKVKFASLASPKAGFKPEDCTSLINVITKADKNGSVFGKRFIKKLGVMKDKTEDALLSL